MGITLKILGGGREIGANSYLLAWGGQKILLDCGFDPRGKGYEEMPAFDLIRDGEVDAAIISHAHLDHIGSLPFFVLNYLKLGGQVFMTPPNIELVPHMLTETVKALHSGRIPDHERYYYHEFFNMEILERFKERGGVFQAVDYHKHFEILPGLRASFFPAGHILGAAGVVITDGEYKFVYTGDMSTSGQTIQAGCALPEVEHVDCLLIESTHGADGNHPEPSSERLRLAGAIRRTIKRNGHVLIPSFSLGRVQDTAVMLSHMKDEGLIPADTPIFHHAGITEGINSIYDNFITDLHDLRGKKISKCSTKTNGYFGAKGFKKANHISPKPAIFLFTSGMMNRGTPAARLAADLIQSEENGIFFCGYTAPNELGYELANVKTGQSVCLDLKSHDWRRVICPHIEKFSFSGHASREDLLGIAGQINADCVLWVHGDEEATKWLLEKHQENYPNVCCHAPYNRETIILKQDGKVINRPLNKHRAVIVTVGTSLLTSYLNQSGETDRKTSQVKKKEIFDYLKKNKASHKILSAETNTISRFAMSDADMLYFVASDNREGKLCGEMLSSIYQKQVICRVISVAGLLPNAKIFHEQGMQKLTETILDIIESHSGNAVIHATGGFKAQIALATLMGILQKVPVYYLHQNFTDIVSLPEIPIEFDYRPVLAHQGQFFSLLDGKDYKRMDGVYSALPETLKPCFYRDAVQKRYCLTPLGRGIFERFRRHLAERGRQAAISVSGESSLWGEERDSLAKILNPFIGLMIERISRYNELIKSIEFTSISLPPRSYGRSTRDNYLELIESSHDQLLYNIIHSAAPSVVQDILRISTTPGSSRYLLQMLGRRIYP